MWTWPHTFDFYWDWGVALFKVHSISWDEIWRLSEYIWIDSTLKVCISVRYVSSSSSVREYGVKYRKQVSAVVQKKVFVCLSTDNSIPPWWHSTTHTRTHICTHTHTYLHTNVQSLFRGFPLMMWWHHGLAPRRLWESDSFLSSRDGHYSTSQSRLDIMCSWKLQMDPVNSLAKEINPITNA